MKNSLALAAMFLFGIATVGSTSGCGSEVHVFDDGKGNLVSDQNGNGNDQDYESLGLESCAGSDDIILNLCVNNAVDYQARANELITRVTTACAAITAELGATEVQFSGPAVAKLQATCSQASSLIKEMVPHDLHQVDCTATGHCDSPSIICSSSSPATQGHTAVVTALNLYAAPLCSVSLLCNKELVNTHSNLASCLTSIHLEQANAQCLVEMSDVLKNSLELTTAILSVSESFPGCFTAME